MGFWILALVMAEGASIAGILTLPVLLFPMLRPGQVNDPVRIGAAWKTWFIRWSA